MDFSFAFLRRVFFPPDKTKDLLNVAQMRTIRGQGSCQFINVDGKRRAATARLLLLWLSSLHDPLPAASKCGGVQWANEGDGRSSLGMASLAYIWQRPCGATSERNDYTKYAITKFRLRMRVSSLTSRRSFPYMMG